jgi:hypothetical protein
LLISLIDFSSRFCSLLGFAFKKFTVQTSLAILAKKRENAAFVGTENKEYFCSTKSMILHYMIKRVY